MYAALKLHGIDVKFDDLLEPKYVTSWLGSSAQDLQRAVTDFGAHAEPMTGLTAAALRASEHPVILHVRRPGKRMPFAHWVLYLGVEDGKARIVDPPNSVELVTFAELLSLWDGVGVVVSRGPEPLWDVRAAAWAEFAGSTAIVAATLGLTRLVFPGLGRLRRRTVGAGLLLLVAVGVGLVVHTAGDEGVLRNRGAVGQVVGQHFQPHLPTLTYADLKPLVGEPGVVLIDARYPEAFGYGHIPGAVNLPVYAGLVERREVLSRIPSTARIVVYCHSESCSWAASIATDVAFRGYDNVSLYPGGWVEWEAHERPK